LPPLGLEVNAASFCNVYEFIECSFKFLGYVINLTCAKILVNELILAIHVHICTPS
jgi:hypothetical protein